MTRTRPPDTRGPLPSTVSRPAKLTLDRTNRLPPPAHIRVLVGRLGPLVAQHDRHGRPVRDAGPIDVPEIEPDPDVARLGRVFAGDPDEAERHAREARETVGPEDRVSIADVVKWAGQD